MKPYHAVKQHLAKTLAAELHRKVIEYADKNLAPHATPNRYQAKKTILKDKLMEDRAAAVNHYLDHMGQPDEFIHSLNMRVMVSNFNQLAGFLDAPPKNELWLCFDDFQRQLEARKKAFECFKDPKVLEEALKDEEFCQLLTLEDDQLIYQNSNPELFALNYLYHRANPNFKVTIKRQNIDYDLPFDELLEQQKLISIPKGEFTEKPVYVGTDPTIVLPADQFYQLDNLDVNCGINYLRGVCKILNNGRPLSAKEFNFFVLPCNHALETSEFAESLQSLVLSTNEGDYQRKPIVITGIVQCGKNHFVNFCIHRSASGSMSVLVIDPTCRKYIIPEQDGKLKQQQQIEARFKAILGKQLHFVAVPANQQPSERDCAFLCLNNLETILTQPILTLDASAQLELNLAALPCHAEGRVDWARRECCYPESLVTAMQDNRQKWSQRFTAVKSIEHFATPQALTMNETAAYSADYDYAKSVEEYYADPKNNDVLAEIFAEINIEQIEQQFILNFVVPDDETIDNYAEIFPEAKYPNRADLKAKIRGCIELAFKNKRVEALCNAFARFIPAWQWQPDHLDQIPFDCVFQSFLIDAQFATQLKKLSAQQQTELSELCHAVHASDVTASFEQYFAGEFKQAIKAPLESLVRRGEVTQLALEPVYVEYSKVLPLSLIQTTTVTVQEEVSEDITKAILESIKEYCDTLKDIDQLLALKNSDLSTLPFMKKYEHSPLCLDFLVKSAKNIQFIIDQRISMILGAVLVHEFKLLKETGYFRQYPPNAADFFEKLLPSRYRLHAISWNDPEIKRIAAPLIEAQRQLVLIDIAPHPSRLVPSTAKDNVITAIKTGNILQLWSAWFKYSSSQQREPLCSGAEFFGVGLSVARAIDWVLMVDLMKQQTLKIESKRSDRLIKEMITCIRRTWGDYSSDPDTTLISAVDLGAMLNATQEAQKEDVLKTISDPVQALYLTRTAMSQDTKKLSFLLGGIPGPAKLPRFIQLLGAKLGRDLNCEALTRIVPFQHAKPLCLGDIIHAVVYLSQDPRHDQFLKALWSLVSQADALDFDSPLSTPQIKQIFSATQANSFFSLMIKSGALTPLEQVQRAMMMMPAFWQHADLHLLDVFTTKIHDDRYSLLPLFLSVIAMKAGEGSVMAQFIENNRERLIQQAKGKLSTDVEAYLKTELPLKAGTPICKELEEFFADRAVQLSQVPQVMYQPAVHLVIAANPVVATSTATVIPGSNPN